MSVRRMRPDELPDVAAMMQELYPTSDPYDFGGESVFVWERDEAPGLGGFISFSLRDWAEGCDSSPVPISKGGGGSPLIFGVRA